MTPPPEDPQHISVSIPIPALDGGIHERLSRQDVILGRLDENIALLRKELLGNGQPGRLTKVESKVNDLENHSSHLKGWIIGAGGAITLALAIAEFFLHK